MSFLGNLPRPFLVLAPMDDVTDQPFRQLVSGCHDPDVYFTEFANADGLNSAGRSAVLQKLQFGINETLSQGGKPLIAQIWGKNPDNFKKTANELVEMGFDGVDLNFGCPVANVVKNGCCSALAKDPQKALSLIKATQEGAAKRLPVSVKCRLGFDEIDMSWIEFLLSQKLDMLTVHGRTTREQSKVPMHWEVFDEIVALRDKISPHTVLVANGDVQSYQQAQEKARQYKLDGIMIGRAIFKDPFVFSPNSLWSAKGKEDRIQLFIKHINLFDEAWGDGKNPYVLKKFTKIYINGFDGATRLRTQLMACDSFDEMKKILLAQ